MSRQFSGSGQFLDHQAGVPATGVPITMAAWVKPDVVNITQRVLVFIDASAGDQYFLLSLSGTGNAVALTRNAATAATATSSTATSAGVWAHIAAVFSAANSRAAFLNGGGKGTDATSSTPIGIDSINVACRRLAGPGSAFELFDGAIALLTAWNVALTDAEIAILAKGVPSNLMRSANIIGFWPLLGYDSPEPDWSGGNRTLALTGSPTFAANAPVSLWMPRGAPIESAAVATGAVKFGSSNIAAAKAGTAAIGKIYQGSNLIVDWT